MLRRRIAGAHRAVAIATPIRYEFLTMVFDQMRHNSLTQTILNGSHGPIQEKTVVQ